MVVQRVGEVEEVGGSVGVPPESGLLAGAELFAEDFEAPSEGCRVSRSKLKSSLGRESIGVPVRQ